ncbi:ParB/RepB/Spo0J family partition protein [Panacibacter ginsenosidivorans]|uniref:ParB/RepB/Spo0J family partition protein n=1 Tax=Panacibacter ginsenosidivorans TaxID=1813871 RepID=A0A5B8VFP4_9BACT|nr:ParB/RepB/Spo0J family partition protein [Panacibacter ginsenosidivorans]QEC69366.1 ParB/RepB/Spo0J family partition protein [Panacibacter ginsenosidivorans]
MKTAIKSKAEINRKTEKPKKQTTKSFAIPEGERESIALDLIDYHPSNRRRLFNQNTLQELAADIALHGLIHDVTVRPKPDGRFELLAGRRRTEASRIACLKTISAHIVDVTDDVAKEIIFSENAHRENPHPLDDALLIAEMQEAKKTTKEIALRLCKSESFVLGRAKLIALIEPFQEIFIADKMTLQEALQLAAIAPESQLDFFEENCSDWKEDEDFELGELSYELRRYTYDLTKAPFDIKDKKLVPEAGACSRCPFNTATMSTLFPDEAQHAICTNKACYHNKCSMHYQANLVALFAEQPAALVVSSNIAESLKKAVEQFPAANGLPIYDRYNVQLVNAPQLPDKADYTEDNEDGSETLFDETAFAQAMEEYENDLHEYNQMIEKGTIIKGLQITSGEMAIVYFIEGRYTVSSSTPKQTAKEVQEAIKAGTVTAELLQGEIERLETREKRAKELDREKVQLRVHEEFIKQIKSPSETALTQADHIAARLLVYHSLDYTNKNEVDKALQLKDAQTNEGLYQLLAALTDVQFSYLIRMALAGKSDSKFPNNITAYTLYQTAAAAGVDVGAIESLQQQKAIERQKTCDENINKTRERINQLEPQEAD